MDLYNKVNPNKISKKEIGAHIYFKLFFGIVIVEELMLENWFVKDFVEEFSNPK